MIMKIATTSLTPFAALSAVAVAFSACRVEQTEEAEMPEVDVSVEGGNLPKYNVDTPKVDVTMKEENVPVPTVEVEEKTIEVPEVEVTPVGKASEAEVPKATE